MLGLSSLTFPRMEKMNECGREKGPESLERGRRIFSNSFRVVFGEGFFVPCGQDKPLSIHPALLALHSFPSWGNFSAITAEHGIPPWEQGTLPWRCLQAGPGPKPKYCCARNGKSHLCTPNPPPRVQPRGFRNCSQRKSSSSPAFPSLHAQNSWFIRIPPFPLLCF